VNDPSASLSVVTLFVNADPVVKGVLLLLLAASVWSWAVIIDKLWRLGAASRTARDHEARAAAARSAQELLATEGHGDAGDPAGLMLSAGLAESTAESSPETETAGERRDRIERAMRLALNAELRRLEVRLPFLATLGSAAPFIGLFGTVMGIIRAFHTMAIAGTGGFGVVAGGISEALIATALGLAVGIVAVVCYNYFQARVERIDAALRIGSARVLEAVAAARRTNGVLR
jgi:biopolymer transport protein TolQ